MSIEKEIENLFGKSVLNYFNNKNKGGSSNDKGVRYESFFAIMQLARLFYFLLQHKEQKDFKIISQAEAFVDDLLIIDIQHQCYHHYQFKNTDKVYWGEVWDEVKDFSSFKTLATDFYLQNKLNDLLKLTTELFLVCSNQNRVETLKESIPAVIKKNTTVIYFEKVETLNHLLLSNIEFKTIIQNICYSSDLDKLEALSTVLLGHWENYKITTTSVQQLLTKLQTIFPNYLARNMLADLLPETKNILIHIPYFTFKCEKGYFHWSYYQDLNSGIIAHPIDSESFLNFQREIIAKQPHSFLELEEILLCHASFPTM